MSEPKISIITPSYNMLSYLKRCTQSIRDQQGVAIEHIIIDGASTDGTAQWLQKETTPNTTGVSEKDNGMYDAINKGLKMAKGEIIAYLNCDEQYLPGTLEYVSKWFEEHPEVDMIFGNTLLTRPDGTLIAYRKGYPPRWPYIVTSHLYLQSCTMFFRRKIIEKGYFFDTTYRIIGDEEYIVRLLRSKFKIRHVGKFLSVFTMTGQNLSVDENAVKEKQTLLTTIPFMVKKLKLPLNLIRLTEKFFNGAYFVKKPLKYAVYTDETGNCVTEAEKNIATETKQRNEFEVHKASFRWRWN